MSNAPRAWVAVSGQDPDGVEHEFVGQESLRKVRYDPVFARVALDTSVNPPRLVVSQSPDNTGVELSVATPLAIGTAAAGDGTEASAWNHVHAHGNQLGGSLHALAVAGVSHGFISATHQTKLEGIETGADVTDFGNVSTALSSASSSLSFNGERLTNVGAPVDGDDADTPDARNTAITTAVAAAVAAIVKYQPYHWSYSSGDSGAGATTPKYIPQGPYPGAGVGSAVRGYPVVVKMKPISITIFPPATGIPTNAVLVFAIYSNGVVTTDTVEINNNLQVQATYTFPTQGTLNAGTTVDLRVNVKAGSTVSIAMQTTTFTVLFQEVP